MSWITGNTSIIECLEGVASRAYTSLEGGVVLECVWTINALLGFAVPELRS
jgi:hypothetical protein